MPTISEIEDEIAEEFEWIEDPMDRYEYIIELGKKLPAMDKTFKTDELLVRGCQSKVWLRPRLEDGKLYFDADSNTVITKGIIALLVRVLSGHTPGEIQSAGLSFIDKIGLRSHLSSQRSNGLSSMIKQMKHYAASYA